MLSQPLSPVKTTATEDQETADLCARIETARAAIVAHTGGKRGLGGEIPCPCCEGGTLRYSVSGYNGHVRGACTTKGCARWIE